MHDLANHQVLGVQIELIAASGCRVACDDLANDAATGLELPLHRHLVAVVPVQAVNAFGDVKDGGEVVGTENVSVTGADTGAGRGQRDQTRREKSCEKSGEEVHGKTGDSNGTVNGG